MGLPEGHVGLLGGGQKDGLLGVAHVLLLGLHGGGGGQKEGLPGGQIGLFGGQKDGLPGGQNGLPGGQNVGLCGGGQAGLEKDGLHGGGAG